MFEISIIEFILFFCYPLLMIAVSIYLSIIKEMNSERYFFADKSIHWITHGISLTAATFISPYILGLTRSGYLGGFPVIYGIITAFLFYIYGWILIPYYSKINIKTIPQYFEIRYNKTFRHIISSTYIFINIGIRLVLVLAAGNILINLFTNLDSYFTLLFFLIISCISLIISGLKAELYINAFNMLFIALFTIGFAFWFFHQYQADKFGTNEFLYLPLLSSNLNVSIIKSLLAFLILGFWFVCADQIMIQRTITVKNIDYLKRSSIVSMLYQIIPVLFFTLIAVIIFNLFPQKTSEEIKNIFSGEGFLPEFMKGAFIITLMFVLTSLLLSCFNNTAYLLTFDFYSALKPNVSERELVLVGRITVIVLLFISILLLSVVSYGEVRFYFNLFNLFFYVISIIAAFLLGGLLFNSIPNSAAISIFLSGLILIAFKVICEIFFSKYQFSFIVLKWLINLDFLEYSIFIFSFSFILLLLLSKARLVLPSKSVSKKSIEEKLLFVFPVYMLVVDITNLLNI
ncbi:sodium:solute symporter family transporter [Rosettibacter firmus]|uniref:sodium:solute symporter family transporter n=1 Tax=Rosettibacter firmus TaxID=3111522 RepID=UPI00336BC238